MNYDILCGDYKAPKFIICEKCNRRGHRRADCPRNKGCCCFNDVLFVYNIVVVYCLYMYLLVAGCLLTLFI